MPFLPWRSRSGLLPNKTNRRTNLRVLVVELLEERQVPTAFTVLSAADSGTGTLREAIMAANADTSTGVDVINFNIATSGVQTIDVTTPLPAIERPVTIDGSMEPGSNGLPLIVLQGSDLTSGDGLEIFAANCTVQDLCIMGFHQGAGIVIGQSNGSGANANLVIDCFVGVNQFGQQQTQGGNGTGILINSGAANNTIGGTLPAMRNCISGNLGYGIEIESSNNNIVREDLIGVDVSGTAPAPAPNGTGGIYLLNAANTIIGGSASGGNLIGGNTGPGILIYGIVGGQNTVSGNFIGNDGNTALGNRGPGVMILGSSGNTIGSTEVNDRNVISSNAGDGVVLLGAAANNVIEGNIIGLGFGNAGDGVDVQTANNNTVGGLEPGAGDGISNNLGAGVFVNNGTGIQILGNSIEGNGNLGINSTGGNLDVAPNLQSAVDGNQLVIAGSFQANQAGAYRLEFFDGSPTSTQGQMFLGGITVSANGPGTVPFTATLQASAERGTVITATLTGPDNSTSRFSQPVAVLSSVTYDMTPEAATVGPHDPLYVSITIQRQATAVVADTVTMQTVDGTAHAGVDYVPFSQTITFLPGEDTHTITINALGNPQRSGDVSFTVELSSLTSAGVVAVTNTTVITLEKLAGSETPTDALFLQRMYVSLLGRQVDSSGELYWATLLVQGASRSQIVRAAESSLEYQTNLVTAVYSDYLDRRPDPIGVAAWTGFLSSGGTIEQFTAQVLGSPEFLMTRGGGQLSGFLTAAYQAVFDRPIDAEGAAYFTSLRASGTDRSSIASLLLTSSEEYLDLTALYYSQFLGRAPEPSAVSFWLTALNSGLGEEGLVAGIMGSPEFTNQGPGPTD